MPTEAQLQANRANAKKSSGPKTDEGKARSRLNALKHGMRAQAVDPVLPHEDPAEFEARCQEWLDDYQPTNGVERELVTRAARLSWTLDRAERYETVLLAKQVRKAMLRSRGERLEEVCEWGRKLFYNTGQRLLSMPGPDWSDNPSAFVARLEESPEGARWLLDRWVEIRCLLLSGRSWTAFDQFKFVRLLGKHPVNAVDDPELNEIFLAWETLEAGWGVKFWKRAHDEAPRQDPAFGGLRAWRELVPRPEGSEAAVTVLVGTAQREIERLEDLIVDLDEIEGDDALELAEHASFCASDAGERLRRFQSARTRELLRTIELLTKIRKAEASQPEKKATKEPNPPAPEQPASPPTPGRSDSSELIVDQGLADCGARPSRASEPPSPTPKIGANEPNPAPPANPARRAGSGSSPAHARAS